MLLLGLKKIAKKSVCSETKIKLEIPQYHEILRFLKKRKFRVFDY